MTIIATIGICVRNSEKTIAQTLESINKQDFPNDKLEIIIVDDGSTDNTLKIVKDFASKSKIKTKVFNHPWKGLGPSRNIVVEHAVGKYIIWLDADMMIPRNYVRKQVEFMEAKPNVGAAKARYGILKSKKLACLLENSRAFQILEDRSKLFGTGGAIYRTEAIRDVGAFDNNITGAGEDIDALIRMHKKGWHISTTNAVFYEQFKENWRDLWRQYYWWGYGAHYVKHKHKNFVSIFVRLPPFAFILGILRFFRIYRHHTCLSYVFLPIHSIFKEVAWCLGFIKGHINGYGHKSN